MAGGFSFCGVDIDTIGLEYAPELEDTYVYRPAKPKIHDETFDGHNGGYYYGMSREPKEFVLRCFFEEKEIDRGLMAKVLSLFREGRSGKLVFDRRPWCWYYATVTECDPSGITNYLNGIIKISMKAYFPFARSELTYINRQNKDYNRAMANSGFFEAEHMIPPTELVVDEPITQKMDFLLSNPGDMPAPLGIEIAGDVGKGVIITNHSTGQAAKFVAMSQEEFDGETNYVYLDSLNGKVMTVKDGETQINFLYHDEGFIDLIPGFPIRRGIQAVSHDGEIIVYNKLYDRNRGDTREETNELLKGQYIWLNHGWHQILSVGQEYDKTDKKYYDGRYKNEHRLILEDELDNGNPEYTVICPMNRLTIEPVSTMSITRLNFKYYPTFS